MITCKTFLLCCIMGALILLLLVVSCCYNYAICDDPTKNVSPNTGHGQQNITPWTKYAQQLAHELRRRAILMSQTRNHGATIKQIDLLQDYKVKENLRKHIITDVEAVNSQITLDTRNESATDEYADGKEKMNLKLGNRVVWSEKTSLSEVTDKNQESENLKKRSLQDEQNKTLEVYTKAVINNEPPNKNSVNNRHKNEEKVNLSESSSITNEEPNINLISADGNVYRNKDDEIPFKPIQFNSVIPTPVPLQEFDQVVVYRVTPQHGGNLKLSSQENIMPKNLEQKEVPNESEIHQKGNSTEIDENVGGIKEPIYLNPKNKETTQKDILTDTLNSQGQEISISNTNEDSSTVKSDEEIHEDKHSISQSTGKITPFTKISLEQALERMDKVMVDDKNNEADEIKTSQNMEILNKSMPKDNLDANKTELNNSEVEPVITGHDKSQNIEAGAYTTVTPVDKHTKNDNNKHEENFSEYRIEKTTIPLQTKELKTVTSNHEGNHLDPLAEKTNTVQLRSTVGDKKFKTSISPEILLAPDVEFSTTAENVYNAGQNKETGMFKIYETLPVPGEPEERENNIPVGSNQRDSILIQKILPSSFRQLVNKNDIINITELVSSGQNANQNLRLNEDETVINKWLPHEKSVNKAKFAETPEITTSKTSTEIALDIEKNINNQNLTPAKKNYNLNSKFENIPTNQQIISKEKIDSSSTSIILPIKPTINNKSPEIASKNLVNNDETKITNAYIIAKYESLPPMSHEEFTEYSEYSDEIVEENIYDDPDSKLALCAEVIIENSVCQQYLNKTRQLHENTKTELSQAKENISELEAELKKLGTVTGMTEAMKMKDMECMAKIAQLKLEFKQYMEVKNEQIDDLQNRLNILMNRKGKGETLRSRAIRERTVENIKNMEVHAEN